MVAKGSWNGSSAYASSGSDHAVKSSSVQGSAHPANSRASAEALSGRWPGSLAKHFRRTRSRAPTSQRSVADGGGTVCRCCWRTTSMLRPSNQMRQVDAVQIFRHVEEEPLGGTPIVEDGYGTRMSQLAAELHLALETFDVQRSCGVEGQDLDSYGPPENRVESAEYFALSAPSYAAIDGVLADSLRHSAGRTEVSRPWGHSEVLLKRRVRAMRSTPRRPANNSRNSARPCARSNRNRDRGLGTHAKPGLFMSHPLRVRMHPAGTIATAFMNNPG
jgi:hypothetical protein